jgi:hypothetical protein
MTEAAGAFETSVHKQITRFRIPGAISSIIISLNSVNRLVFVMETQCVYYTAVADFLSIYHLH